MKPVRVSPGLKGSPRVSKSIRDEELACPRRYSGAKLCSSEYSASIRVARSSKRAASALWSASFQTEVIPSAATDSTAADTITSVKENPPEFVDGIYFLSIRRSFPWGDRKEASRRIARAKGNGRISRRLMLSLQLDCLRHEIPLIRQLANCCLKTREDDRYTARFDLSDFHGDAVSGPFASFQGQSISLG